MPRTCVSTTLLLCATLPLCAQSVPNTTTRYYVAFLRPSPSRTTLPQAEAARMQDAHMANIRKMAQEGILVAAGPFDDTPATISGVFIFRLDSLASAERIAAQDPTVIEHRNTIDVHAWKGPPGIAAEYFRLHKADPDLPQNMQVHPLCMLYRGSAWDVPERDSLLAAHDRYMQALRSQGKLGAAGEIEAPDDLFYVTIFKALPDDEAHKLIADDPAVQAGLLRVEFHHWWCADHVLPW